MSMFLLFYETNKRKGIVSAYIFDILIELRGEQVGIDRKKEMEDTRNIRSCTCKAIIRRAGNLFTIYKTLYAAGLT